MTDPTVLPNKKRAAGWLPFFYDDERNYFTIKRSVRLASPARRVTVYTPA